MRRLVLLSGALLCTVGLGFVAFLPFSAALKAILALTWFGLCGYQWYAMWSGYARSGRLRIAADGHVERQCHDGVWEPARLGAGSVVLARLAWLRIESPNTATYAELVSGTMDDSDDWRRLQVIWRHIGAA